MSILDSIKSLADYIHQATLADRPSLVYSNNDIKAAQTGGGFSFLQLIYMPIVYANNFWGLIPDERLMQPLMMWKLFNHLI